jgi:hypothetical protein
MADTSPIRIRFTGFRRDTYARAIHEHLLNSGRSPQTLEQILAATSGTESARIRDQRRRASDHLNYWTRKQVYVAMADGWMVNPRGVRFEPREFAN